MCLSDKIYNGVAQVAASPDRTLYQVLSWPLDLNTQGHNICRINYSYSAMIERAIHTIFIFLQYAYGETLPDTNTEIF